MCVLLKADLSLGRYGRGFKKKKPAFNIKDKGGKEGRMRIENHRLAKKWSVVEGCYHLS